MAKLPNVESDDDTNTKRLKITESEADVERDESNNKKKHKDKKGETDKQSRVAEDEGDEEVNDTKITFDNAAKGNKDGAASERYKSEYTPYTSRMAAQEEEPYSKNNWATTSRSPLLTTSDSNQLGSRNLSTIRAEIMAERMRNCCCPSPCPARCCASCPPRPSTLCVPPSKPCTPRCDPCCPPTRCDPCCPPTRCDPCCPPTRCDPCCPPTRCDPSCPPAKSPPPFPLRSNPCCPPPRCNKCCPPAKSSSLCPPRSNPCCPSPRCDPCCPPAKSPPMFPLNLATAYENKLYSSSATKPPSIRDQLLEKCEVPCSCCCQAQCYIQKDCCCVIPVQCNSLIMPTLAEQEARLTPKSPKRSFTSFIPEYRSPIASPKISRDELKRTFNSTEDLHTPATVAWGTVNQGAPRGTPQAGPSRDKRGGTPTGSSRGTRGVTPAGSREDIRGVTQTGSRGDTRELTQEGPRGDTRGGTQTGPNQARTHRNAGQSRETRGVTHGSTTQIPRAGARGKTTSPSRSTTKLKR